MTGFKFVEVGVDDTLLYWEYPDDFRKPSVQHLLKLPKGPTYLSIFNTEYQDKELNKLMRSKHYKILFKAPKAVNYTPEHGDKARNVLVVYEAIKDGKGS